MILPGAVFASAMYPKPTAAALDRRPRIDVSYTWILLFLGHADVSTTNLTHVLNKCSPGVRNPLDAAREAPNSGPTAGA